MLRQKTKEYTSILQYVISNETLKKLLVNEDNLYLIKIKLFEQYRDFYDKLFNVSIQYKFQYSDYRLPDSIDILIKNLRKDIISEKNVYYNKNTHMEDNTDIINIDNANILELLDLAVEQEWHDNSEHHIKAQAEAKFKYLLKYLAVLASEANIYNMTYDNFLIIFKDTMIKYKKDFLNNIWIMRNNPRIFEYLTKYA